MNSIRKIAVALAAAIVSLGAVTVAAAPAAQADTSWGGVKASR